MTQFRLPSDINVDLSFIVKLCLFFSFIKRKQNQINENTQLIQTLEKPEYLCEGNAHKNLKTEFLA